MLLNCALEIVKMINMYIFHNKTTEVTHIYYLSVTVDQKYTPSLAGPFTS